MAVKNQKEGAPAEVNEALTKSEAFVSKYKKPIIFAVVAVVVVVLGVFAYTNFYSGPREDNASTEIAKAQDMFAQQQFDKAVKAFEKVASDYSGTDAANLANLYAGLCYANLDKWAEAQKALEGFSPADDAMISPAAMGALGNVYAHDKNNLEKAVSSFKKAAEMADKKSSDGANVSLSPTFLLQAGIILESQGKKDEALKLYEEIKTKYVASQLVGSHEIDKYIERINQSK